MPFLLSLTKTNLSDDLWYIYDDIEKKLTLETLDLVPQFDELERSNHRTKLRTRCAPNYATFDQFQDCVGFVVLNQLMGMSWLSMSCN